MSKVIRVSTEVYDRLETYACERFTNPNEIIEELLDVLDELIDEVIDETNK